MKTLFDRFLGSATPKAHEDVAPDDEGFFSTQFMERPESVRGNSAWTARALGVGAQPLDRASGLKLLEQCWGKDHFFLLLSPAERQVLSTMLDFATVPAGRELITQGERGDYALIVLDGVLGVDRVQPTGARVRLSEARAGEVLGEMSLLELGARFASCTTLSTVRVAVLTSDQLDALAVEEPRTGMAVMAGLAQRLSLRTRQIGARLAALAASQPQG